MKYDVIVIGAGLGGLECAYILSRSGRKVLLLEREPHVGGCLYSYKRGAHWFDTGFHYIGGLDEGQILHSSFEYLGLLNLQWTRLDSVFDKVVLGDRIFKFAQGYKAFVDTLASEFPSERQALETYAAMLKDITEHQPDALNPDIDIPALNFRLFETNAFFRLSAHFKNPLLINVLAGTSLKMELRRDSLPLFTFAHGNASFIESSRRLKGNGSMIAERLEQGIRGNGGTIVLQAEVEKLLDRNGRLSAVKCRNGEVYEGNVVISDVHPAVTLGWLQDSPLVKNVYRRRITELENTFGMFTVSLVLKPGTIEYRNFNYYVYADENVWTFYENNRPVKGILVSWRVPEDGSRYATQIDLLTPMAWSACRKWENTISGRRGGEYEEMKCRMADECITLAERVIPGLRSAVTACYTGTPLTFRDYTLTPRGSAYGVRKDCRHPLTTFLSVRTPVPGLFLTGQNLMLHGLQGVTMTALLTCAEIMGKKAIWKIVNKNGTVNSADATI